MEFSVLAGEGKKKELTHFDPQKEYSFEQKMPMRKNESHSNLIIVIQVNQFTSVPPKIMHDENGKLHNGKKYSSNISHKEFPANIRNLLIKTTIFQKKNHLNLVKIMQASGSEDQNPHTDYNNSTTEYFEYPNFLP